MRKGLVYMDQNVTKKLGEILQGMDTGKINKKTIEQLLKTPEGQKLKEQLGGLDKDKLVEGFMKLDTNAIKKNLSKADLSSLAGMKAEDILKKLR